jgi:hypothetical protein
MFSASSTRTNGSAQSGTGMLAQDNTGKNLATNKEPVRHFVGKDEHRIAAADIQKEDHRKLLGGITWNRELII